MEIGKGLNGDHRAVQRPRPPDCRELELDQEQLALKPTYVFGALRGLQFAAGMHG